MKLREVVPIALLSIGIFDEALIIGCNNYTQNDSHVKYLDGSGHLWEITTEDSIYIMDGGGSISNSRITIRLPLHPCKKTEDSTIARVSKKYN